MTNPGEIDLTQSSKALEALLALCKGRGRVLVLMQDNPDPDALASAMALRDLLHGELGKRVVIAYGGVCGRAENRAMMELLHIDARRITPSEAGRFATVLMVDAQPTAGNNLAMTERLVDGVIDHHAEPRKAAARAPFHDVRPDYGATSTILYEYLLAAGRRLSVNLATALFYGIQSDTQDLGREAIPADVAAFQNLFDQADTRKLARIRRAPLPADYFEMLHESLENCIVAGNTVISVIQNSKNPDIFAEIADLMLRLDGIRCSVCYGRYEETILLSVRTVDARSNAADRVMRVVRRLGAGGGHRTLAGGQIPAGAEPENRLAAVHQRILRVFARNHTPRPLFAAPPRL